ncbi:MAG: type II toxin-antitoxin system PemK/MazF family toxin [Microlunatus sp.]
MGGSRLVRPIHIARLDKIRPALVLTRHAVRAQRNRVTVAPITSTIWGLETEVLVGRANGLDHESVINCDSIVTIPVDDLGRQIGVLQPGQEAELAAAIVAAFDLDL